MRKTLALLFVLSAALLAVLSRLGGLNAAAVPARFAFGGVLCATRGGFAGRFRRLGILRQGIAGGQRENGQRNQSLQGFHRGYGVEDGRDWPRPDLAQTCTDPQAATQNHAGAACPIFAH